ncbi:MAG TPA: hypothetical protein VIR16_11440, partial [Candidatus Limnocylindrales bacterium]
AKILADERERDIRRQLREHAIRRDAEAALAGVMAPSAAAGPREAAAAGPRGAAADRLCPDCPCRVAAPAR